MNRRSFLSFASRFSALAAASTAMIRPARANAYYTGPVSDHFDGEKFFLPGGKTPNGFGAFLRWQLSERSAQWPEFFPSPLPLDTPPARVGGRKLRISFVGHASFLLQTGGINILFDPHFSERASPVAFAGPRRVNPPGIAFETLPRIDVIAVSHNHYDHLDIPTLHRLWDEHKPRIITPLGNDAIIRKRRANIEVEVGDWGDRFDLAPGVALTFEPAQHWSARGMRDRMHALWASFVLESGWGKLWFAGDTGFGDGEVFRKVRARHGEIALGLVPIGAYAPRWFMQHQHVNPADAVKIFQILGMKKAIGYHWGTFKLTNEPVDEPAAELLTALANAGLSTEHFVAAKPGQAFAL